MAFGEAALLSGGKHSADVNADADTDADADVECLVLGTAEFERLERERPSLVIVLLHNLLQASAEITQRQHGRGGGAGRLKRSAVSRCPRLRVPATAAT